MLRTNNDRGNNRWGRQRLVVLVLLTLGTLLASLMAAPIVRADADDAPASQPATLPIQVHRITLHVKDAPLLDVLRSIEWQTGVSLINNRSPALMMMNQKRVTIDVDNGLFWNVMLEIADQSGIFPMRFENGNDIGYMLFPGRAGGMPTKGVQTIYSIAPINANLQRIVDYASGSSENSINLSLQVFVDPAIDLARLRCSATIAKAVDADGNDLLLDGNKGGSGRRGKREIMMRAGFNGNGSQISCQLRDSNAPGRKIALMQGEIHIKGESPVKPLFILDPKAGTEVTQDGTTIKILDIVHEKENWKIHFSVKQTADAVRWNPGIKPTADYSLIDEKGEPTRVTSISPEGNSTFLLNLVHQQVPQMQQMMQMNNMNAANGPGMGAGGAQGNGAAAKPEKDTSPQHVLWIVNLPAPPVDVAVPFELTDLPLP